VPPKIHIQQSADHTTTDYRKMDSEKASRFGNTAGASSNNQFKHQIEVMVLSKVDPFDGAFPMANPGALIQPSELNLTQSFTQPQIT
jgi:hypothetical protein